MAQGIEVQSTKGGKKTINFLKIINLSIAMHENTCEKKSSLGTQALLV